MHFLGRFVWGWCRRGEGGACREEKGMHVRVLHMSCLALCVRRGACVSPTALDIASWAYPCALRRIALTHVGAGERLGAQMCTTR